MNSENGRGLTSEIEIHFLGLVALCFSSPLAETARLVVWKRCFIIMLYASLLLLLYKYIYVSLDVSFIQR